MRSSRAILLVVLLLVGFGLLMIGNITGATAVVDFGDRWYFAKLQLGWAAFGLVVMGVLSRINYRIFERLARPAFLFTLALLVLVLIPGIGLKLLGARRWINLGFFSFQPSEVAKIAMAIYYSTMFKQGGRFNILAGTLVVLGFLIMLQPDLGTFLIISGMGLSIYLGANGSIRKLLYALPLAGLAVAILILIAPYRLDRIRSFLDPESDPQGKSYQIRQILLSLGSGGVGGVGIGQSRQKYDYLPEVATDSIFAVIGEELGLIGGAVLIFFYLVLISQGLRIASLSKDPFGRNLALGISTLYGFQAFMNISSISALFPFTGVPLAFISYGGTSMVMLLAATGILLSISRHVE